MFGTLRVPSFLPPFSPSLPPALPPALPSQGFIIDQQIHPIIQSTMGHVGKLDLLKVDREGGREGTREGKRARGRQRAKNAREIP
jgi:hypothetical protein